MKTRLPAHTPAAHPQEDHLPISCRKFLDRFFFIAVLTFFELGLSNLVRSVARSFFFFANLSQRTHPQPTLKKTTCRFLAESFQIIFFNRRLDVLRVGPKQSCPFLRSKLDDLKHVSPAHTPAAHPQEDHLPIFCRKFLDSFFFIAAAAVFTAARPC